MSPCQTNRLDMLEENDKSQESKPAFKNSLEDCSQDMVGYYEEFHFKVVNTQNQTNETLIKKQDEIKT
jgi:hypothetical protein